MRIGFDYSPAVNQRAGIGRYTRCTVAALAELDKNNEYVLFYPNRDPKVDAAPPSAPNFEIIELPVSERTLNTLWFRLGIPFPVDLITGPVDVCHFANFTLPPLQNGASVLTVHDLSFLLYPEYAEKGLRDYLERIVPPSVAGATLVLADSASTRNDLMVLLDVPPERIEVLYAGVESRFAPVTDEVVLETTRRKYGLTFPFILTLSTIEPRKNLIGLMQAFSQLKKMEKTPHKLVIGGSLGWLYEETLHLAETIDVADDIIFLGYVSEEDLPALYTLADIFALVSFYEGFGLPVLEAMACGTPVVGSNRSSMPEIIGDTGLLVSPHDTEAIADAFVTLLRDKELTADLAIRGHERARLFNWRSTAEQLLALYTRLVAAKSA